MYEDHPLAFVEEADVGAPADDAEAPPDLDYIRPTLQAVLDQRVFLLDENRPEAVVNVMAQYQPDYKTVRHPMLGRRLSGEEFRGAVGLAKELGLQLTN